MKINTKKVLKNFAGEDMIYKEDVKGKEIEKKLTVGYALANIMLNSTVSGKMKSYILAEKLHENNMIDVDEADLAIIEDSVEQTKMYNNLVNGQLLKYISSIKK